MGATGENMSLTSLIGRLERLGPDGICAAQGIRDGDQTAFLTSFDILEEHGFQMRNLIVGKTYEIHTTTYTYVGNIKMSSFDELTLDRGSSRVYDSGLYGQFILEGRISSSEYLGDAEVTILRENIIAITTWPHPLPTQTIAVPQENHTEEDTQE